MKDFKNGDKYIIVDGDYLTNKYHYKTNFIIKGIVEFSDSEPNIICDYPLMFLKNGKPVRGTERNKRVKIFHIEDNESIIRWIELQFKISFRDVNHETEIKIQRCKEEIEYYKDMINKYKNGDLKTMHNEGFYKSKELAKKFLKDNYDYCL